MRMKLVVLLLVIINYQKGETLFTVTINGELKSCDNNVDMIGWDTSTLEVLQLDKENTTLNGKLILLKDYNNPLSVKISATRLVSGHWVPSFARWFPNFCSLIQAPNEMWSPVVKYMKQQSCPFKAGHTETFDNVNLGNWVRNKTIPTPYLTEWKAFIDVVTERDGGYVKECSMLEFLLEDV
ncbi:uncharacterized protein LOC131681591 [Topomyia yanbarensis]|uniref:uncharacterized protein LOC131681591 n=1 Tax=Topomyia yanbarensis TaxID=2498891 RepID=UPI00273AE6D3|nr:uncharacterized protein LOC131681591 [Topomyia yanbarensis]